MLGKTFDRASKSPRRRTAGVGSNVKSARRSNVEKINGACATNRRHHRHEKSLHRHLHDWSLRHRNYGSVRSNCPRRDSEPSNYRDLTERNSCVLTEPSSCGSAPGNRGLARSKNAEPADCRTSAANCRDSGCPGCNSPAAAVNCRVAAARRSAGCFRHDWSCRCCSARCRDPSYRVARYLCRPTADDRCGSSSCRESLHRSCRRSTGDSRNYRRIRQERGRGRKNFPVRPRCVRLAAYWNRR